MERTHQVSARWTRKPYKSCSLLSTLPEVKEPSLAECGADETWLSANYTKALEGYTHRRLSQLSSKQVDLFKSNFVDLRRSQTVFEELFRGWHTDDSPKVSVAVKANNLEYGI